LIIVPDHTRLVFEDDAERTLILTALHLHEHRRKDFTVRHAIVIENADHRYGHDRTHGTGIGQVARMP
jgi:hypothetical protein